MATRPVYFDCDTGIDDALALVYLMASPEIIGKILPVHVESLERYSLLGHLAAPPAQPAGSRMTTGA